MTQYTLHTSWLFDPKVKQVRQNISITVNLATGLITRVFERDDERQPLSEIIKEGDIDLRGKYILPGLVDAHTHVFLHSYEWVSNCFIEAIFDSDLNSQRERRSPAEERRKHD